MGGRIPFQEIEGQWQIYRGFFYCPKIGRTPLLPRQWKVGVVGCGQWKVGVVGCGQWKVGVVGCGHLTTTIKRTPPPPFGLLDPPLQSHTFLCKEVDRSAIAG